MIPGQEIALPKRPVKVYQIDPSIKLTAKQAAFVYEYLKDYNATQAAIRAGYKANTAKTIAWENLTKPDIQKAVEQGQWFYQYQNGIDADWIRKQLVILFNRCMQAEPVMEYDREEKRMVPTGEYVFKDATAKACLELMGKDVGMFATKVDINQTGVVQHEHTVRQQMDFETVRTKVDTYRPMKVVSEQ